MIRSTRSRRSNVGRVLVDDMTRSRLPDGEFRGAVAVEVLEHVEEDELFLRQVRRVLAPGGFFLMTTPNGDCVPNTNPDHKRHYTFSGLSALLQKYFVDVQVEYAIRGGPFHHLGLRPFSIRHPVRTATTMLANLINSIESRGAEVRRRRDGTRHLIALARKASAGANGVGATGEVEALASVPRSR